MKSLKHSAKCSLNNWSQVCEPFEEHKTSDEKRRHLITVNEMKRLFIFSGLFYVFMILKQMKVNFFGSLSKISGKFAEVRTPKFMLVPFLKIYSAIYGVNLEEMEVGRLTDFPSFSSFFTRKLKPGIRKIEDENDVYSIWSPWDGTVYNYGDWSDDTFVVVKDTPYRIDEFLFGKEEDSYDRYQKIYRGTARRGNKLKFILFYLSPGDYHRYHSAAKFSTNFRRHVPGKLYPVKPSYVANHPNVFKENERVSLCGEWANGFFSTTFIGATNVGSIVLNFDKDLRTNVFTNPSILSIDKSYVESRQSLKNHFNKSDFSESEDDVIDSTSDSGSGEEKEMFDFSSACMSKSNSNYPKSEKSSVLQKLSDSSKSSKFLKPIDTNFGTLKHNDEIYQISSKGIHLEKGQEIGYFNLGSSIMLIFEASEESTFDVEVGQKVKLGNSILKVNSFE
jgi:phosphatidylserine decarboxylase precursor